jgi:hypothetical protein
MLVGVPSRQVVEFGVEIGEYRGVVRVPRHVFQRLLSERPRPSAASKRTISSGPGSPSLCSILTAEHPRDTAGRASGLKFGRPAGAAETEHRSRAVASEFQREHPRPSTGLTTGPCPGYWRDHIVPLAAAPMPSLICNGRRSRTRRLKMSGNGRLALARDQSRCLVPAAGNRPITDPEARARAQAGPLTGECQLVGAPLQVLRAAVVNPRQPEQLLASVGPARFLGQFAKPVCELSIVLAGRRVVGIIGHDARSDSAQHLNVRFKGILQREQRDREIREGQLGPVTSALGSSYT